MGKFTAIAIGNGHHQVILILMIVEHDNRHFREFPAHHISVLSRIIAQFMRIHLLKKMLLLAWPIRPRIAGVPKSAAVRTPSQATACGAVLHIGNNFF